MNSLLKKPNFCPKRKVRVTIIVGIICKDAIVLACDSQSTRQPSKRTDTEKISVLKLDGKSFLVAQAGDCEMSSRTVEIMSKELQGQKFDDYRKPADIAQKAVAMVKKELAELNDWQDCRERAEAYLEANPFSLMLAYYYLDEPHLFVLSSVPGFATREKKYAAIGCGGTVGEFILGRANVCSMDLLNALVAAIYTVEEVKKVDAFCGGPAKAAVLTPTSLRYSESESKPMIKEIVEAMRDTEYEVRVSWEDLIRSMIEKLIRLGDQKKAKERGEY